MENYIDNHNNSQKSFKRIFSFIIEQQKTTRRAIQKYTDYSWGSVSSVVSLLLDKGYVIETESVKNGVGRGTSYIIPNGTKYVTIGIDVNSIGFSSSVVGIDGEVKYKQFYEYLGDTKDYVIGLLFEAIDDAINFIGNNSKIVSIGVSCQGSVDLTHSIFQRFAFAKDLSNCNLKEIVENKYGVYTFIEHDTNCLLEDYLSNYGSATSSVCIARAVSGIGFAICVNGQSLEEFGTIDFGRVIVQPNKDGKGDDLEAYASTEGIAKRAKVNGFNIIDNNREKYRDVLNDAAFYFGATLANVNHIFSLEEVIFTGNVIGSDETMVKTIIDAAKRFSKKEINIKYISDLSATFGAAKLSLISKIDNGIKL